MTPCGWLGLTGGCGGDGGGWEGGEIHEML